MENSRRHIYSFDLIRILAIVMILFNHTKQYGFELYTVTDSSVSALLSMALAFLCKAGVPLFLMVSGALLLGKEESVSGLLKHRVRDFAVIFAVMFFLQYARVWHAGGYEELSLRGYIQCLLYDDPITPYWFLRSYLLYLLTLPFLRFIALKLDRQWFRYLLCLQAVIVLLQLVQDLTGTPSSISFFTADAFVFYPLAGYYLFHHGQNLQKQRSLWLLCLCSSVILSVVTGIFLRRAGHPEISFALVPAAAVSLFLLICGMDITRGTALLKELGSSTFGIYLIEDIVRNRLEGMITPLSGVIGAIPAVLCFVLAVFAVSALAVGIGKRIPGIRYFLHAG